MTNTFDLSANSRPSRVLTEWVESRPGAAHRAGVSAAFIGENSTTSNLTAEELTKIIGGMSATASGVAVTPDTAMRVSAVYGCVSLIAGAIASLPLAIYDRETKAAADHPYWWMFNEAASQAWTSAAAWEYLITAKLFYGDGFARLVRSGASSSRVIGWEPLHPMDVRPFRDDDGRVYYRVTEKGREVDVLDSADVIHLPSLGFDGLTSPSPITYAAREAIGTALSAETYSARFFNGGATFDYALQTDAKVDAEQMKTLRASLMSRAQGGANGRSPLILTGGLKAAQLSVNSKDAEILATRLFGVEEICRILGVPPHMVAHTTKTTSWGSGIAEQGAGFVRYTLLRHLNPLRQELNRKLWPVRQRYYIEHVTEGLERADLKNRSEAHRIALGRAGEPGWMTVNEVRGIENMPPINGGDELNKGVGNANPPAETAS